MAAGVPVISTNLESIREFITDGENGMLVRPGDVNEIVERMKLLWPDDDLHASMSTAAVRTVRENFSIDKFLGRVERLYGELV